MRKSFLWAVPLVFCLIFASCSNAQQLYDKGNYQGAISKINRIQSPTAQDQLLKAKSLITLGRTEEAKASLLVYLLSDETNSADRQFAVRHFLQVNTSDNLAIMALKETDGTDSLVSLYRAYSRKGDISNAIRLADLLYSVTDVRTLVEIMLSQPSDSDYLTRLFFSWYDTLLEEEKDIFLIRLDSLSKTRLTETAAKQALALTDLLAEDDYYTTDSSRLSLLLKVKGNVLEKLFDKVNARLYWSQAYRLNPEDEELRKRVQ